MRVRGRPHYKELPETASESTPGCPRQSAARVRAVLAARNRDGRGIRFSHSPSKLSTCQSPSLPALDCLLAV